MLECLSGDPYMMLRGVTKSVFDHLGSEQVVVFIEQINNNNINPIQKKRNPVH